MEKIRTAHRKMKNIFLTEGSRFSVLGKSIIVAVLALFAACLFIYLFVLPAEDFPSGTVITLEKGEGLSQIAATLEKAHVVHSSFWFSNIVMFQGGEKALVAGDYYFEKPISPYEVSRRITKGRFGLQPVKVTIPEGFSIFDIAKLFGKEFSKFDQAQFLLLAKDKEGYLFPDTYFFMPNVKAEEVIAILSKTYKDKIEPLRHEIESSHRTEQEIITMASILEEEARTTESRRMISGILWKRIANGMPLQVDAAFRYVNGKTTKDLTLDDLKIDSPYNTYLYPGLPPTPISNPGLDSIEAALNPTPSKYVYFLTDNDGEMHYATTLQEHTKNKQKYLK